MITIIITMTITTDVLFFLTNIEISVCLGFFFFNNGFEAIKIRKKKKTTFCFIISYQNNFCISYHLCVRNKKSCGRIFLSLAFLFLIPSYCRD